MHKQIIDHRALICASVGLAVLLGIGAEIYPMSYVAYLTIQNSEGNFTLNSVKRLKHKLPVDAQRMESDIDDDELKRFIQNKIEEPKWVQKNIMPVLSITKSDTKDAITAQNGSFDAYKVEWLYIEVSSNDINLLKNGSKLIGSILCKLNYKENLVNYITGLRNITDATIRSIYEQLPGIEKSIDQMQESIKILRDINQKYPENAPEQTRLQLSLPVGENKDNLSSLAFLTAYLPQIKQLAILETQLAQALDNKKRLKIEGEILKVKSEAANHALEKLDVISLNEIFNQGVITYKFSRTIDFDMLLNSGLPEWAKNYIFHTNNKIREDERVLSSQFERQMYQIDNILVEEKYKRDVLVILAILTGLFLPTFLRITPFILRLLIKGIT